MKRLLKAELFRLSREVPFLVIGIIYIILNILSIVINMNSGIASMIGLADVTVGEMILSLNGISNLGIFAAIAISIFNGREFKHNTIRNKITAGYKREQIFFSVFIVNMIMYTALFIVGSLVTLGFGSFMLTFYFDSLFALELLLIFLLGIAFCAFTTFFSFATKSTAGAMLSSILIGVVGYVLLSLASSLFATYYFANASGATNFNYGFLEFISRINIFSMDYFILAKSALSVFGDVSPFYTSIYINSAIVGVVWTGLFAVGGWLVFRRADIK